MKRAQIKIQFKTYHNKSRQGTYIQLKSGKKTGLYKWRDNTTIDVYKLYFQDQVNKRGKGSLTKYLKEWEQKPESRTRITRQKDAYLGSLKKKGLLADKISRGLTKKDLDNVHNRNNLQVRQYTMELLAPLVKDKGLLELISSEENMNKLKHRLTYEISYLGDRGLLGKSQASNKTPYKLQSEIRQMMDEVGSVDLGQGSPPESYWAKYMADKEHHNVVALKNAKITNVRMIATFKKAR